MNEKYPKTPNDVAHIDWDSWEPEERAVLCLVRSDKDVLLIHKKTGLGAGKINAPGGRIDPGELPIEAAIRETQEETGITPSQLVQTAELSFIFTNGYSIHGTVFLAHHHTGTLTNTREALPYWCPVDNLPYTRMWEDDPLWLPSVFEGYYVKGRFIFDDDTMLSKHIEKYRRSV
jgi:8-oxo-dGTP diphosphatase